MLEDRPTDAELVIQELRRGGYDPAVTRVEDEASFRAALESTWDLVLADFKLLQYDAVSALRELKRKAIDLPLIIVAGSVGEEVAVAAVREGAAD
ncbi:MAG TPA: response regulator, partial [Candidatus Dormibacteraeota bacterium]|nr:response regulator [Candidatus Dormibacteraeota bacterium]